MSNDASLTRRAPLCVLLAFAASCGVPRTAPSPAAAPSPTGSVRVLVYKTHAGKDAAGTPRTAELANFIGLQGADIVLLLEAVDSTRRAGGVNQSAELVCHT